MEGESMDSLVLNRAGILLPHALLNRRSVFLCHCWALLCHLPFQASLGKAEKISTYEPSEILACSDQGVSPFHPWPELEKTPLQPWDELKIGALSLGMYRGEGDTHRYLRRVHFLFIFSTTCPTLFHPTARRALRFLLGKT